MTSILTSDWSYDLNTDLWLVQVLNNTDVQVGLDSNGRPNVAVVPKTPRPAAIQAQVMIPDCLA